MKSFPNFPDCFPRFLGNETLRTFTLQGTERKGDGIRSCVLLSYLFKPFLITQHTGFNFFSVVISMNILLEKKYV